MPFIRDSLSLIYDASYFPRLNGPNVIFNTSSKFVMTDGLQLLLESVKLETGVFSASLPTLVTAAPAAVVGSLSKSLRRPLLRRPEVKKPRNDAVRMLGNDLSP